MHEALFDMAGDQTMTSASLDVFVATRPFAAKFFFVFFLGLTAAIGEDAAAHSYQCQYQAAILGAAFACKLMGGASAYYESYVLSCNQPRQEVIVQIACGSKLSSKKFLHCNYMPSGSRRVSFHIKIG